MEDITYYPKTKSIIDVIRINYKQDKVILTIYYTNFKPILNKKIKEKFDIKDTDIIYREEEEHEFKFHKKEKPFEFHLHIKLEEDKLKPLLKEIFKIHRVEKYHLERLFSNYKRKKFSDGSYLNQDYCDRKHVDKTFNYAIKSKLATNKEIFNYIFEKRGNWKKFDYGNDLFCQLLSYDYQFKNDRMIFVTKSFIRNNIVKSKQVNKLIEKVDEIDNEKVYKYHLISTLDNNFIHNQVEKNGKIMVKNKINTNIFKYIVENIEKKCYPENKYCYIIYEISLFNNKIIDIKYDIDYFNNKDIYLDILEGIMYHIVDNMFPPLKKVNKYKNFIFI